MAGAQDTDVMVLVYDLDSGRRISGARLPERLADRADDIRKGIQAGVGTVLEGIRGLPRDSRWAADEVSVSFALTLEAEAGVLLSKASAAATLEVSVVFRRVEPVENSAGG
ncbi:hypothetical protein KIF24_20200 [Micromonospora sp. Llam7]|uniref:CU044_2847 family protein n=1 Tax=Micromonospora tarapacensis TaxID=2835305 RepID=UPI001C83F4B7|nr:CU044_2847 family protein [Micromonospora tarapacensis]MBX7268129.1 hypothetical protein [Micromonospora tarapacensis]